MTSCVFCSLKAVFQGRLLLQERTFKVTKSGARYKDQPAGFPVRTPNKSIIYRLDLGYCGLTLYTDDGCLPPVSTKYVIMSMLLIPVNRARIDSLTWLVQA